MTLTTRLRRGLIAGSIAAAAVALPAVALASSAGTSTAANTTAVHRCYQTELRAWLGIPGGGAAGSTYYELELSNVSGQACTLYGYPGVSALTSGHQDGSAADRTASHPSTLVLLEPGATSHVILQITDVGNFSPSACNPVTADTLRVYAPGDYSALQIPFSVAACGTAGPVYLHVSATVPGTGIPGYSN
jgi:Protein of unknown function (DUF4232)